MSWRKTEGRSAGAEGWKPTQYLFVTFRNFLVTRHPFHYRQNARKMQFISLVHLLQTRSTVERIPHNRAHVRQRSPQPSDPSLERIQGRTDRGHFVRWRPSLDVFRAMHVLLEEG